VRFTKMHGLGNDYVCIGCSAAALSDPPALAKRICDRHFGVGSDGLILILPSDRAGVRMRIFNPDGSEAEMCGNGLRCVAKYAHDNALSQDNPIDIETLAGVRTAELILEGSRVVRVVVDMGEPSLEAKTMGLRTDRERVVNFPLDTSMGSVEVTCVSVGNPHAVIFVEDVSAVALEKLGPEVEHHTMFTQRTNVHFVQVESAGEISMVTWERGTGATLACGTGAAAACAAGVITARTEREVVAQLPGGQLHLNWREEDGHVIMTGPAEEVFTGEWPE